MSSVELSWIEEGVAELIMNRPRVRNAVNFELMKDLDEILNRLEQSHELKAVLIRGANETFCSGGDLFDFHTLAGGQEVYSRMLKPMTDYLHRIACLPCPVTAYVQGAAVGGGAEIAMASDNLILAPDAKLGFIQVKLGIQTGWGGAALLKRHVDLNTAEEMLSTGKICFAKELQEKGFAIAPAIPGADSLKIVQKKPVRDGLYQEMKNEALNCSYAWGSDKHGEMIHSFINRS